MIYRYRTLNVFHWNSYTMVVQSQTKFDDFIFFMKRIETRPEYHNIQNNIKMYSTLLFMCQNFRYNFIDQNLLWHWESYFPEIWKLAFKTHMYLSVFVSHHNRFLKLDFLMLYFLIVHRITQKLYQIQSIQISVLYIYILLSSYHC